jgi:hypothetical protein
MSRYLDNIPQPWSRETIETAVFKGFMEARAAIEDTEGGCLWRALRNLQDSVWILETGVTELLDEISVFADRSRSASFWRNIHANEADTHTKLVKRYIFNCTIALMALVDHARNFQKHYPVDGYADKLAKTFATPGLHTFLQCFRNYNTHWRVAEANWNIKQDFQSGKREVRFVISKSALLEWDGWSSEARGFIDASPNEIDIQQVFFSYRESVHNFYSWHTGAVLDQYAKVYKPYLEYKRIYDGVQHKCYWNALLSHAPKGVNPYEYIGRYLSERQLEAILALRHRSADQVDALIRMLGMEDFCDAELRTKAVSLFRQCEDEV